MRPSAEASGYDAELALLAASLQEQEYEEEGQQGAGGGGGGLAAALQAQVYEEVEDDVPSHPHFGPTAASIFHRSPCECVCMFDLTACVCTPQV